jgi:hypothetical protein
MDIEISTLGPDPLYTVMSANLTTIGKEVDFNKYSALTEVKKQAKWYELLEAEHSTLAFAPFIVRGEFRSDAMHQLARSTKGLPRFAIQSHRPDWTGKDRPPSDSLRSVMMMWNPLSWMAMCRERLCGLAMKETRITVDNICCAMVRHSDPLFYALGNVSIPMCHYRMRCPYGKKSCGRWERENE